MAREVLSTAFSFALISITGSLQALVSDEQIRTIGSDHRPDFLCACEGLVPQTLIDRTAAAMSAGFISREDAEAILCSLVLEERLRPHPWTNQREPDCGEVARAVGVAKKLISQLHAQVQPR